MANMPLLASPVKRFHARLWKQRGSVPHGNLATARCFRADYD